MLECPVGFGFADQGKLRQDDGICSQILEDLFKRAEGSAVLFVFLFFKQTSNHRRFVLGRPIICPATDVSMKLVGADRFLDHFNCGEYIRRIDFVDDSKRCSFFEPSRKYVSSVCVFASDSPSMERIGVRSIFSCRGCETQGFEPSISEVRQEFLTETIGLLPSSKCLDNLHGLRSFQKEGIQHSVKPITDLLVLGRGQH